MHRSPIDIQPDSRNYDMTIQNNLSGKTALATVDTLRVAGGSKL
jgi:hypothetical protein